MIEEWKDIVGYETLYQVSNLGRIKSFMFGKERILSTKTTKTYPVVILCKDKKHTSCRVHRLVAQHFIKNPDGKSEVNHIDGVKQNNAVSNLEWVTPKENIAHSMRIGHHKTPPDVSNKYFTQELIDQIRCAKEELMCGYKELCIIFKMPHSTLYNLCNYGATTK